MKFQQLRYLVAVHENGLNITAAARQLHTSQPGVSRQLKLLEEELGFQLFEREGRALTRTTAAGEEIISRAGSILREMQNIRRTSAELRKADGGTLSIATTHTQARYVLPPGDSRISRQNIRRCDCTCIRAPPSKLRKWSPATASILPLPPDRRSCSRIWCACRVYRWHRAVVVPRGHPLASAGKLTLRKLAEYPIVTYVFSFSGRSSLPALFETAGLSLDVALTARDSDVIKTYVRIGLGVGHLGQIGHRPRHRFGSRRTRRGVTSSRGTRPGSAFGAARCCAPICTSSSNYLRRTYPANWCAKPRNWRPKKRWIAFWRICTYRCATMPRLPRPRYARAARASSAAAAQR